MNNFYDKIKSKIDIIDVIDKYVAVTKKSSGGLCICPFHNDTKPSLSISSKLQIFNCFVCGAKGDAISFVSKYESIPYFQAAKKIIEEFNLGQDLLLEANQNSNINFQNEREYVVNEKVGLFFHNFLFNQENKFALDYLKERQLDEKLINHFNLGYAPENDKVIVDMLLTPEFVKLPFGDDQTVTTKDLSDIGIANIDKNGDYRCFFRNRIMIPIYDSNNHLVGFSGRAIDKDSLPKYLNTQTTNIFNKDSILFNYQNVLKLENYSSVYLVEGYMDVFGLYRAGIENAVATMGVALTENHIKLLKYNHKINSIVLAYDNDDAGREATLKAGKLIGKEFNVLVVKPFKQLAKDFDELYCNYGKEKAFECANNLIDFVSYALIVLSTSARNDYVKMNDFLTQAFDIIYNCGREIELNNYFIKIKDLYDKSEHFKDKYSVDSIRLAYEKFVSNKDNEITTKSYYTKNEKSYAKTNNKSTKTTKTNESRYSYKNINLSQKELDKKFSAFGSKKKYIENDLYKQSKNIQKEKDFEIEKNNLIQKINNIENCLLISFFKFKQSINTFEKTNDIKCSFLTKSRQQLFNIIKQWYANHNSRGTMIYDEIDVNDLCQNNIDIINAYNEMQNVSSLITTDDITIWKIMTIDWLILRIRLLILLKNNEISQKPEMAMEIYKELKNFYETFSKLNQQRQNLMK